MHVLINMQHCLHLVATIQLALQNVTPEYSLFLRKYIEQTKCVCVRTLYDSRQEKTKIFFVLDPNKIDKSQSCRLETPVYQCIEKWCRNQEFQKKYIHNLNSTVTAGVVFDKEFCLHIYQDKPDGT